MNTRGDRVDRQQPDIPPTIEHEIVNVVGCGGLATNIDLPALADDLDFPTVEPEPSRGKLLARTDDALTIIWNSGVYTVRGVDTIPKCRSVDRRLRAALADLDPQLVEDAQPFSIKNVVAVGDLERHVNLTAANIALGLESCEYEPEQFAGLVWRTDSATLMLFANGRVISVGATSVDAATTAIYDLQRALDDAGLAATEASQ